MAVAILLPVFCFLRKLINFGKLALAALADICFRKTGNFVSAAVARYRRDLFINLLPFSSCQTNRFTQGDGAASDLIAIQGESAATLLSRARINRLVAVFA
jgi:hypothetical protein